MNEIIKALKSMGKTDAEIAAFIKEAKGADKNKYRIVPVVRLYWANKPSREDREAMGKAGFHWNGFEKFWYADATAETVAFATEHGFEKEEK